MAGPGSQSCNWPSAKHRRKITAGIRNLSSELCAGMTAARRTPRDSVAAFRKSRRQARRHGRRDSVLRSLRVAAATAARSLFRANTGRQYGRASKSANPRPNSRWRNQWRPGARPGPGHSPKDRSLSVKIDTDAPDGFVVHSFSGDDPIVCRDYVRERLGLPAFKPNGNNAARLKTKSCVHSSGS